MFLHQFDCDCSVWKAFHYSNEAMLLLKVFLDEMPSIEPRHLCQVNTHQGLFQGHFVLNLCYVKPTTGQLPPKNACLLASDPL